MLSCGWAEVSSFCRALLLAGKKETQQNESMVVPKLIRSKDVKLEGEVGHPMLDVNMLDLSDGRHAGCVFS